MTRPLVALCCYHLPPSQIAAWSAGAYALPDRYVARLRHAGVEPLLIVPGADIDSVWDVRFSGLVLAGGGDIDPRRYDGDEDHPSVYGVVPERDESEVSLLERAVDDDLPVLAICRGMQLLNVARGGSLVEHLPDVVGSFVHGDPVRQQSTEHDVHLQRGSRLAEALGDTTATCCVSFHHQAIRDVGRDLQVVGRSNESVVEALEATDASWVVGVQWHPEIPSSEGVQEWLFAAFAHRVMERAEAEAVTR